MVKVDHIIGVVMFSWAVTFFIIAIIAALFGFGGIAGSAAGIAQILFFVGLVLFLITGLMHLNSRRGPKI